MHFKSLDIRVEEKKKESSYHEIGDAVIAYMLFYLNIRNIFNIIPLIDRRNQQLIKRLSTQKSFWQSLYAGPFDIKISQERHAERKINNQSLVLYCAVSAGATEFLLEECRGWNLNIILSIAPPFYKKKKFILLEFLYQSQLLLIIPYLKKSRTKRQPLEKKFKSKFLELKTEASFEYLQLPDDELQSLVFLTEEKNQTELVRRCDGFSTILNNLKLIITEELSHAESKFTPAKLNYLKLYFKILFWNKTDDADAADISFQKMLFESLPSFTLNFNKGEDEIGCRGPLHRAYPPEITNGLLIGVDVGNLHFLEAFSDNIRSCSFLTSLLNTSQNPTILNVREKLNVQQQLLLEAIRNQQEAVTQFLLEQITQSKQKSSNEDFFQPLIKKTICNNYYYLTMLVIAHAGGISTQYEHQEKLLEATDVQYADDLISVITLSVINIDMNAILRSHKKTLLEKLSANTYLYLKMNHKEKFISLPIKLEKIRLLIVLGADFNKFVGNRGESSLKAIATINYILKRSLQPTYTPEIEEIKEVKPINSTHLSAETYIPYLKKISFFKFGQEDFWPMQSKIAPHTR